MNFLRCRDLTGCIASELIWYFGIVENTLLERCIIVTRFVEFLWIVKPFR